MSTIGRKMTVTMVMTLRVYDDDEALCTVRSNAAFVLETITRGYRKTKMVAAVASMATAVARKAQPSRWERMNHTAARIASTARTGTGARAACPAMARVQAVKPITASAASGAS